MNLIHYGGSLRSFYKESQSLSIRMFKCIAVMKLILALIAISLQVTASTYAQQITLSYKNAALYDVMQDITEQSGYSFTLAPELLKKSKPVTITLKSATIEKTLQDLFNNQPFIYKVQGKIIMVVPKPAEKKAEPTSAAVTSLTRITGTVRDESGNPLPGATVLIKGTALGSATDKDGRFSINNAPEDGTLIIRMIGRESREISYRNGIVPEIKLQELEANLSEFQVIAYGQVEKKYSTSNIGTIKAKDIQNQPVTNVLLAMAGRVPGLFIKQQSGVSSGNVDITVQGRNSLINSNDPFYVIDGIPYSSQFTDVSLMGGAIVGPGGSALSFINPADIESITVLKDADATAIYGSRAANGAILITTKKGNEGRTQVDFNLQNGWGKITKRLDVLNTEEYLALRREAYGNARQNVPTPSSNPTTSNYDLSVWDPNKYTDWQDELVGGTAFLTNVQASVSGGNASTQFLASYGYIRETTVYPESPSNVKGNVHLNLNHTSKDNKFKYIFSGNFLQGRNKLYNEDLMRRAILLAPNAPDLYNPDGTINFAPAPKNPNLSTHRANPATTMRQPYKGITSNLLANNTLSYEILSGLQLKLSMGINRLSADETKQSPITILRPELPEKTRRAQYLTKSINSWIIEPQLTYAKMTNVGAFDVLIGGTIQQIKTDILQQTGSGFSSDAQLENIAAAPNLKVDLRVASLYKYNALFGRLNYRLRDKYILNLTARRDGSSRFGAENKLHNFYSVGGAWIFSAENFFKESISWLSFGKLKANYGTTGNDQITDYRYLSLLQNFPVDVPYLGSNGIYPTNIANPYIQWEETRKLNMGIELGFIKDKIFLYANYFRNRSSNQLLRYNLPYITGFDFIDRNFPATVQNTGVELQLDGTIFSSRKFTWSSSANLTIPRNKLVAFPGIENTTYADQFIVGRSTSILKVYKYEGVNQTTGLYEFVTAKGDKTSNPDPISDRTELIDLNPKFYGGFTNTFQYAGFILDILFQFAKQNGLAYRFGNVVGAVNTNQPSYVVNRWRKAGDVAEIQKASLSSDAFVALGAANNSDANITNASYVRLKNVALSYNLPAEWINRAHITRARLFVQGQNLLTITKYVGLDPETQTVDAMPPIRMINAGFQFTF
ncbi:SusC/RagA family TonB-linked outer membrane protein [Chitinophaga sp. CF418]|uniref:SusC/RagA family TonB-linked outer membrane protein n=1 Tax=Chitinophaga sp. CF418 TaxID=1855287 RepID=UPI0009204990|nr:SusC/RagA family TonB-linked outer membrane protein [Chitinophaga sp. CF418]SHM83856.1 TonB-linked outer membrane protein, SusC/RagA family [Chitinophaga sp. CF418]